MPNEKLIDLIEEKIIQEEMSIRDTIIYIFSLKEDAN